MLTLCLCWNETYCTILAQFLNLFPNAYYFNLINDKFLSFQMLSICYASGIRSKVTPMNAEYPYQLLSLKNPCQECKLSVKTVSGREPRLQWYHSGRLSSPQELQPWLGALVHDELCKLFFCFFFVLWFFFILFYDFLLFRCDSISSVRHVGS